MENESPLGTSSFISRKHYWVNPGCSLLLPCICTQPPMEMAAGAELPVCLCHQETLEKNHELMIYKVSCLQPLLCNLMPQLAIKPTFPLARTDCADAKFFSLSFNSCVSMHRMAGNASMWATAPLPTALRRETCGPS